MKQRQKASTLVTTGDIKALPEFYPCMGTRQTTCFMNAMGGRFRVLMEKYFRSMIF